MKLANQFETALREVLGEFLSATVADHATHVAMAKLLDIGLVDGKVMLAEQIRALKQVITTLDLLATDAEAAHDDESEPDEGDDDDENEPESESEPEPEPEPVKRTRKAPTPTTTPTNLAKARVYQAVVNRAAGTASAEDLEVLATADTQLLASYEANVSARGKVARTTPAATSASSTPILTAEQLAALSPAQRAALSSLGSK
jgi:hypothetical protein